MSVAERALTAPAREVDDLADDLPCVDAQRLPQIARRLVRRIGIAETLVLLRAHGGAPLRFADQAERAGVLRTVLRAESVAALCADTYFRGQIVDLPKVDKLLAQIRDELIRASREPNRVLARRYDLTTRRIKQIRNGEVGDDDAETDAPVTGQLF